MMSSDFNSEQSKTQIYSAWLHIRQTKAATSRILAFLLEKASQFTSQSIDQYVLTNISVEFRVWNNWHLLTSPIFPMCLYETVLLQCCWLSCRFSPPIFLFLISIIPSIWILELHHQQNKDSDPLVLNPRNKILSQCLFKAKALMLSKHCNLMTAVGGLENSNSLHT